MPEMPGPSLKPGPGDPPPPVWRRFFHAGACSTIPLVGIYASGPLMVLLLSLLSGAALVVEGLRLWAPGLNRYLVSRFRFLLKESEERRITGATYIALSALVAFLVFDKPVAVAAMFFLALGDPAAALVGARVTGPRVFGKSPLGSLAFFGAALAISGVLAAGGVLPFGVAVVAGAAIAALVELLPLGVDDNVVVPLVSGAAMTLMGL